MFDSALSGTVFDVEFLDGKCVHAKVGRVLDMLVVIADLLRKRRGNSQEFSYFLRWLSCNNSIHIFVFSCVGKVHPFTDFFSNGMCFASVPVLAEVVLNVACRCLWAVELTRICWPCLPVTGVSPSFSFSLSMPRRSPFSHLD